MTLRKPYVLLFQETLARRRPKHWKFWLLVGCVMVNRARWEEAQPIHAGLMGAWPSPEGLLAGLSLEETQDEMRPLGFPVSRARVIRNLAFRWLKEPLTNYKEVQSVVGLGQYAADSWAIFVDGKRNVKPKDKRLREFLREEKRIKAERATRRAAIDKAEFMRESA